jgi:hypothetical protein
VSSNQLVLSISHGQLLGGKLKKKKIKKKPAEKEPD